MIIDFCAPKSYCELDQDSSIRFSPLIKRGDGCFKELWYGVSCRDKMNELPMLLRQPNHIPDFNGFDFKNPEWVEENDKFYLLVTFEHIKESTRFKDNLHLLSGLEERIGKEVNNLLTTIEIKNDDKRKVGIVMELDKWWVSSPLILSLLTFTLRAFSYTFIGPQRSLEDLFTEVGNYCNNFDNDTKGGDEGIVHYLNNPMFNLEFVLSNIDELLGDNPLTGEDDKLILLSLSGLEKNHYDNSAFTTICTLPNRDVIVNNRIYRFRDKTFAYETRRIAYGFAGFFNRVEYAIEGLKDCIAQCVQSKWIVNYIELLLKKGILTEDTVLKIAERYE